MNVVVVVAKLPTIHQGSSLLCSHFCLPVTESVEFISNARNCPTHATCVDVEWILQLFMQPRFLSQWHFLFLFFVLSNRCSNLVMSALLEMYGQLTNAQIHTLMGPFPIVPLGPMNAYAYAIQDIQTGIIGLDEINQGALFV